MWADIVETAQAFLPLPPWVEHAALAFVIICLAMLFQRSTVCRVAFSVALLVSGAVLLDLVPQQALAAVGLPFHAASFQSLITGQRQFAEIALLSLGSAWILDELRALLMRRQLAKVAKATAVKANA